MRKIHFVWVLVMLIAFSQGHALALGSAHLGDLQNGSTKNPSVMKNMTSESGVKFLVRFSKNGGRLVVHAENPRTTPAKSGIAINVDSSRLRSIELNLTEGERWTHSWNITKGIRALNPRHVISVSTYGNSTKFNFTRKINTTDPGPIPTPKITNVKIANGTIDGEPSAVAKVTVENPSIQTYPTKLMVHTQGTDGSFYGASVPPGENRTITVELLDDRGSKIAGEARLYANNLSKRDGAMDQVGFVGRAEADTSVWNETYEPVNPPWMKNSYHYRNQSLSTPGLATRLSDGWTFGGVPGIYAVLAGLVLVLLGLKVRG